MECREVKTGLCRNRTMQTVLLRRSLAGNPVKPFMSLFGTEWRERSSESTAWERGYGL
jgi:hypothetical protein